MPRQPRRIAAAFLIGLCCGAASAAAQPGAAEPRLGLKSQHMQVLLATPMPAGYFEQLVVVQKFRIAEDPASADALQRYVDAEAMAALENTEWKASATVRDAISRNLPAVTAARTKALFSTVIEARPAEDVALQSIPANTSYRAVAPGLWAAESNGGTIGLRAVFQARNATRARIETAFGDVVFADPAIHERMSCEGLGHPIGPGESSPLACTFFAPRAEAREKVSAAWTAETRDAPPWKVVFSEVHFADPVVQIAGYTLTPFWSESGKARVKAAEELAAVSCRERDACFEDKRRQSFEGNPLAWITLVVLALAAIPGWFIGRFATRPGRFILRCFLAMCALVLLGIASSFALGSSWTIAAIFVLVGGGALTVIAILGLALGCAAGKAMRARAGAE